MCVWLADGMKSRHSKSIAAPSAFPWPSHPPPPNTLQPQNKALLSRDSTHCHRRINKRTSTPLSTPPAATRTQHQRRVLFQCTLTAVHILDECIRALEGGKKEEAASDCEEAFEAVEEPRGSAELSARTAGTSARSRHRNLGECASVRESVCKALCRSACRVCI